MTNVAWFHCFSGIAGDMALGSLIDAGADVDAVRSVLRGLNVNTWTLDTETTQRAGVRSTRVIVGADEGDHVVRTFRTIRALIEEGDLPSRVRQRSLAVFEALAVAEGKMHGQPPEDVHFHEVGGIDAIVDIVGTCAALELLDIDEVYASSIATGTGYISSAHGTLPNPAPAVVELLKNAPMHGLDHHVELTTPTGAAILAALCNGYGPMPALDPLTASGFGAGGRDLHGMPNCTQVLIGRTADVSAPARRGQPVMQLEANVDDATGEVLAHAVSRLIEAGAHDAWITPMIMKKGRPAYTVSALADVALARDLTDLMMKETGSLGVRGHVLERWPSSRGEETIDIGDSAVSVKTAPHRSKPEFADVVAAAESTGRPVREVLDESQSRHDHPHPHPHPHDH